VFFAKKLRSKIQAEHKGRREPRKSKTSGRLNVQLEPKKGVTNFRAKDYRDKGWELGVPEKKRKTYHARRGRKRKKERAGGRTLTSNDPHRIKKGSSTNMAVQGKRKKNRKK